MKQKRPDLISCHAKRISSRLTASYRVFVRSGKLTYNEDFWQDEVADYPVREHGPLQTTCLRFFRTDRDSHSQMMVLAGLRFHTRGAALQGSWQKLEEGLCPISEYLQPRMYATQQPPHP